VDLGDAAIQQELEQQGATPKAPGAIPVLVGDI
jgi:hypothetical protein